MIVVSVVGMAGAGKSEVSRIFAGKGFATVRFGDVTDEELRRRCLEPNEQNERTVRESLRQQHGMGAYAKLNLPRIESALGHSDVVLDGLYSWEEYLFFVNYYGGRFRTVAVCASPEVRYARLVNRAVRCLDRASAIRRDRAEIEHLNKGGPIAMADFTIVNEAGLPDLRKQVATVAARLRSGT